MVLAVAKCGREAKQQGLPTRALMLGLLLLYLLRHLIDTGHLTRTIHKAHDLQMKSVRLVNPQQQIALVIFVFV